MKPSTTIPTPTVGDVLFAARALDWLEVEVAGFALGPGEAAWRARVEAMEDDERLAFWVAWGRSRPPVTAYTEDNS